MAETTHDARPPLYDGGHALVVTYYVPPAVAGTPVTMRNLLKNFDPKSYTVVAQQAEGESRDLNDGEDVRRYVLKPKLPGRVRARIDDIQLPVVVARLARLAREKRAKVIVGVYPDYHMLAASRYAARLLGLPWVTYLHDTIAEGLAATPLARRARRLQAAVFREADQIFVMSDGMRRLFARKYARDCEALEHTYPERPASVVSDAAEERAFWGGSVYAINDRSVARVSAALGRVDWPLEITTTQTARSLAASGVTGDHVKRSFYPTRAEYLAAMGSAGLLVLALNWPDESKLHEDELATIFPTKTPEYLAAGRPILVHCPEHYFLAEFFREHDCGVVVSERSTDAIEGALRELWSKPDRAARLMANSRRALERFDPQRLTTKFRDGIAAACA